MVCSRVPSFFIGLLSSLYTTSTHLSQLGISKSKTSLNIYLVTLRLNFEVSKDTLNFSTTILNKSFHYLVIFDSIKTSVVCSTPLNCFVTP